MCIGSPMWPWAAFTEDFLGVAEAQVLISPEARFTPGDVVVSGGQIGALATAISSSDFSGWTVPIRNPAIIVYARNSISRLGGR